MDTTRRFSYPFKSMVLRSLYSTISLVNLFPLRALRTNRWARLLNLFCSSSAIWLITTVLYRKCTSITILRRKIRLVCRLWLTIWTNLSKGGSIISCSTLYLRLILILLLDSRESNLFLLYSFSSSPKKHMQRPNKVLLVKDSNKWWY